MLEKTLLWTIMHIGYQYLGGIGISLGLLLYGYRIIRAIGLKLCKITPSRYNYRIKCSSCNNIGK